MKKNEDVIENIIVTPLEELMGERFGRYSKYIIQERALPDARDGLKPVQRRILYTMHYDGNTSEKPYRKSAKSVGLIMGNFHPHGDSSIYDAMVRMSQSWKSRIPLIDMHGNNGSMDDDPPAAMRYTEARLSTISKYMLMDIEKDTVLWSPNFDDTEIEPTVLPARYPNLLVNGISGIAAGYATNIPPHNISEVINATVYRIKNPTCNLEELMEIVKGPDFPTGGIVQGLEGIKEAFETGKGRVVVRAKATIETTKTIQQIVVTEIPYEVIKCNLVKKIDDIRLNKKIDGIGDVRDESDRNGLKIVIDIKKDSDANLILNYLYKNTDLQVYFNYNNVAIVNKRPTQVGLIKMLDCFIAHRDEVITKRSIYELNKKEKRCHILEGLIKAISVLDEVISIIRHSNDKADSIAKLIDRFSFTYEQSEAIVLLRLYRLSNTDVNALRKEYDLLQLEMENLRDILNNPKTLRKVMINELEEVNKEFGLDRISEIQSEVQDIVIDKKSMINNERVMFTISKDGYVKKVSLRSYTASDTITGLKEGDELIGVKEVNTLDYFLFFTSKGTYGYAHIYEIDEYKWKDVGIHLNSIIKMDADEKIIGCYTLSSFDANKLVVTCSKYGMIKTSNLKDYEVTRNSKTMSTMNLDKEDEMISVSICNSKEEVILISKNGYTNRYALDLVTPSSPKAKGVKAIKLVDDLLVAALTYDYNPKSLVLISENSNTKRLKLSEVSLSNRAVKGELISKKIKSNPNYIRYAILDDLNNTFSIMDNEVKDVILKDVSLMAKDASFSSSVKFSNEFYLIKGILDVDFDVNDEVKDKFEEIDEVMEIDPSYYEEMSLF